MMTSSILSYENSKFIILVEEIWTYEVFSTEEKTNLQNGKCMLNASKLHHVLYGALKVYYFKKSLLLRDCYNQYIIRNHHFDLVLEVENFNMPKELCKFPSGRAKTFNMYTTCSVSGAESRSSADP